MADDDIDVEGEFDLKTELGDEFYDTNELPSKSANLLPEFTSPAWMLEQGWSLDSCMDEKSKATIEKMLLEEQQYMYGKKNSRFLSMKKNVLLVNADGTKTTVPSKTPWTDDEKKTFLQGMGIFGRSWSKIASLIPTRTNLQVKNYAQQYMKNLAKKKAEAERAQQEAQKCLLGMPQTSSEGQYLSPLKATIASVTTGKPTVAATSSSTISNKIELTGFKKASYGLQIKTKSPRNNKIPKNTLKNKLFQKNLVINGKGKGKGSRKRKKGVPDVTHTNAILAFSDVSGSAGATQEADLILNRPRSKGMRHTESNSNPSDGHGALNGTGDVSNGSSSRDAKSSDDEDLEVDIDIENDDDDESNTLLQGRSASPSSVYQQLLRSAHIEVESSARVKKENVKMETGTSLVTDIDGDNIATKNTSGAAIEDGTDINAAIQSEIVSASDQSSETADISSKENASISTESTSHNKVLSEMVDDREEDAASHQKDDTVEQEDVEPDEKSENIVNGVLSTTGEVFEFEIPTEEKILSPNFISEEEKQVHSDFFDGRPPKTPERYLKIRSYLIDCWKKSKPTYLNKTSVRSGLKNCGDVNCIGRIHSYLECIGAINFSCEQVAYRNPNKTVSGGVNSRMKGINKELIAALPAPKTDFIRPRKRRIRDQTGLWVDEKELEGKTIEHDLDKKKPDSVRKPKVPKPVKPVYDPFKLVPCLPFSEEYKAPYKIDIFNTALSIMDIHSHISKTEVIGMLGGQFCPDDGCLTISMAVPCKSMSTGMQCEMDPVSQTLASEQIEDVGMSVVGWYHSHPTFSPDPSVRDIETQQKFQYWFSKGGNHFVGMIISPYNAAFQSVFSDIRCLTISDAHGKEFLCNIPYKFDYQIVYKDNLREILGPASELAEKYSNYVNRVMLSCQYKTSLGITCLSKMLQSVKRHLIPSEEAQRPSSSDAPNESNHNKTDLSTSSLPSSSSSSSSSSSTTSSVTLMNRSKIDEVLYWLEQIFIEKFTQPAPLSPTMDSLASTSSFASVDFDHQNS